LCRLGRFDDTFAALGDQRRLQRFNVVWECAKIRIHAATES